MNDEENLTWGEWVWILGFIGVVALVTGLLLGNKIAWCAEKFFPFDWRCLIP